jgi:hypothetical protein
MPERVARSPRMPGSVPQHLGRGLEAGAGSLVAHAPGVVAYVSLHLAKHALDVGGVVLGVVRRLGRPRLGSRLVLWLLRLLQRAPPFRHVAQRLSPCPAMVNTALLDRRSRARVHAPPYALHTIQYRFITQCEGVVAGK